MDDRIFFQFEAAWDSSLHNSLLLNKVSNYGEQVYLTLSAYMEIEGIQHSAVFTKDLSLLIYARDSKISAASRCATLLLERQMFWPSAKASRTAPCRDRQSLGQFFYLLTMKEPTDSGALRRQRRVLDTSSNYVRGEENLGLWRPRGDSLIFEHQWELEKLAKLQQVERVRLFLRLREKLKSLKTNKSKQVRPSDAIKTPVSPTKPQFPIPTVLKLSDEDKKVAERVLHLMTLKIPVNKEPPTGKKVDSNDSSLSNSVTSPLTENCGRIVKCSPSTDMLCRSKSRSEQDLTSSSLCTNSLIVNDGGMKRSVSGSQLGKIAPPVPEVTEERDRVLRRPKAMLKVPNTFSVCTTIEDSSCKHFLKMIYLTGYMPLTHCWLAKSDVVDNRDLAC
uniref:Kinesin-like domain-containing protein n=1 Tax=Ditylenchus dipsaci TaxID=166011 RepID=A0A915EKS6_9BILA